MEFIFLGTGTSVGIPMIGCSCPVCNSSDHRNQRTRCSLYVRTPELKWVVDTGPDFRAQCLRENISKLDAALYTHGHVDHILGFDELRRFCYENGCDFPIYADRETMGSLQRMFEYAFNGENRYPGYIHPEEHLITGSFVLGETTVVPIPVQHGKVPTYGFVLEREGRKVLGYFPDCKMVEEVHWPLVRGVQILVIDGLRHAPHPTHMNLEEAQGFAREMGAEQTWFTHLSHEVDHAVAQRDLRPGMYLAYDGLRLSI